MPKKKLRYEEKLEKYGFAPNAAPEGTVEKVVSDLYVPTGREGKYNKQAPKGFGTFLPAGIDGYETDRFGRPIPKLGKEEVIALRKKRVCPAWPYCSENPHKCFFACQKHWYMMPAAMRTHVWIYSRNQPNMPKLKAAVEECVTWLHLALGPSIMPERLAKRVVELLPAGEITEAAVECCVKRAVLEGEGVSHAPKAREVFERTWKERLEFVWY